MLQPCPTAFGLESGNIHLKMIAEKYKYRIDHCKCHSKVKNTWIYFIRNKELK